MKVIEITETIDALADYANSQEVIILTRNGQAIAALTPLKFDQNIDNIPSDFREMIEKNQSRKKTELETTFYQLVEQWRQETRGVSSTEQLSMHSAYQQIIGMGSDVIPMLLRELERNSGRWFWALKSITREDPVTPEQQGKTKEMIESWLNWGRKKGYIW
jgi:antitoxin (DNA-binding transcriptional repressor) of toxin-antitoxin stability system